MANVSRPASTAELRDLLLGAAARGDKLELRGGGTKADIGWPDRERAIVDMRGFSGVIEYDPGELVMTVRAGTALTEIESILGDNKQMLAFEPFDYGMVFGRPCGDSTIGGVVMANVSGPRRLSAGGARDHVLGFEAVSGRGEAFKAGGRVVKNVTGFDLPRLLTGSWGRLAAVTALSLKVVPQPQEEVTVLVEELDDRGAAELMARALGSAVEVSAAAHLPGQSAAPIHGTALRLEGFGPSVEARAVQLRSACSGFGSTRLLDRPASKEFWRRIREMRVLPDNEMLWRIALPPAYGHRLMERLRRPTCGYFYDWGGGLIWLAASSELDVRAAAQQAGAQATLVRAPPSVRMRCAALQPESEGTVALRRRIKAGFDPAGILDPDRFAAGEI